MNDRDTFILTSTSQKRTWDQWHRSFGHIAIPSLEHLNRENMVNGLAIDQSSIPSKSCDACIQAKQARKSYPQEAKNCSQTPGERVMSDVWGPAGKESIGKWKYYISFTDDCTRYSGSQNRPNVWLFWIDGLGMD